MKLHRNRPIRNVRRPLFFSSNELGATVLREFSDAQLEYYSYIVRKKYANAFMNGATTEVPGHIKVEISDVGLKTGVNTTPTTSSGDYISLASTGQTYTEGVGGIEDKALVEIYRFETKGDNTSPPPGADMFPSPAPNLSYRTADSFYNFFRNDKQNNASDVSSINITDFLAHGYITTAEIIHDNTSSLMISNTTVENAGILKLEHATFVDGISGDNKLILNNGATNKEYRIRQVGMSVDSSNTSGTARESEEYVMDVFLKDVEEKIRSYDVGAVRIDNYQLGGATAALANEPNYNVNQFVWSDAGLVYRDTRYDPIYGNNPLDAIYEYNMYVNTDLLSPLSPPTYNGNEIRALKAVYGTDLTDGRRLQELSNDPDDDFIANFLYRIFLGRYPVYDFSLTQPDADSLSTEMGFVTDTHFGAGITTITNALSGGTYTKLTETDTTSSSLASDVTYFVFKGLRGDTPTYWTF